MQFLCSSNSKKEQEDNIFPPPMYSYSKCKRRREWKILHLVILSWIQENYTEWSIAMLHNHNFILTRVTTSKANSRSSSFDSTLTARGDCMSFCLGLILWTDGSTKLQKMIIKPKQSIEEEVYDFHFHLLQQHRRRMWKIKVGNLMFHKLVVWVSMDVWQILHHKS